MSRLALTVSLLVSHWAVFGLSQDRGVQPLAAVPSDSVSNLRHPTSALALVDTAWVRTYDGLGGTSESAIDIALDAERNVYVTGSSGSEYATLKYGPDGVRHWLRRFSVQGSAYNIPAAIGISRTGDTYVTGTTSRPNEWSGEFATVKYDTNGDVSWIRTFGSDRTKFARDLCIDSLGNAYVAGQSGYGTFLLTSIVVCYGPQGDTQYVFVDTNNTSSPEAPLIALEPDNSLVVSGIRGASPNLDSLTFARIAPGGSLLWRRSYGLSNMAIYPTVLRIDESGFIYIAGYAQKSSSQWSDLATMKLDADGDSLWVRLYDGAANDDDRATGLAMDSAGNVFVTGWSSSGGTDYDYLTLKYDSQGNVQWERRLNGDGGGEDEARSLALDIDGSVYVTGFTTTSTGSRDCTTVKYSPAGSLLWASRASDFGFNYYGSGSAIVVDDLSNVYVTGFEVSAPASTQDYLTIKYSQCSCACHSDPACDGVISDILDVVNTINVAFRGAAATVDPNAQCPNSPTDMNCSGATDVIDVVKVINVAFRGANVATEFCEPCE